MTAPADDRDALARRIDGALPQTQCTRCGYPDCRAYAEAIARDGAAINRCPPGGAEGVARLAALTGRPAEPLDAGCGPEGPRRLAVIDEAWCIGCTLCLKACPVDCISGSSKHMHTVIEADCTGCELCVPVCPVDCIEMIAEPLPGVVPAPTGWAAWSEAQAGRARQQYDWHRERLARERVEHEARLQQKAREKHADLEAASKLTDPAALERKRTMLAGILARAQQRAGVATTPGAELRASDAPAAPEEP